MTKLMISEEEEQYKSFLNEKKINTNTQPEAQLSDEETGYANIIKMRKQAETDQLRQSLMLSVKKNPDDVAKIENLSKQTGVPQDTVERNLAEVIERKRVKELEDAARFSPILAKQMQDPSFTSVAYDDVEHLTGLEYVLTKGRDYAGSGLKGVLQPVGGTLSGAGEIYDVATRQIETALEKILPNSAMSFLKTPIPWWLAPGEIIKRPGVEIKNFGGSVGAPPERQGLDTDVIEGIGQLGSQIGLYLVAGPAASTATMLGQGADIMAEKTRDDVATQSAKDASIVLGAGITVLTERYGLDKILNRVPPEIKNRTLRFIADKVAAGGIEAGQEIAEGILHDLTRKVLTDENAPILEDGLREASAAGLSAAIVRAALGTRAFRNAKQQEDFFNALGENSKNSKLRQRLPEKFQELIETLNESGPIKNIFIPSEQFNTYFQEQGVDPADKARELGIKNYTEAVAGGNDLVVPIETFTARLAPTDDLQGLFQDLRLTQDDMTGREFAEYKKEEAERERQIFEQAKQIQTEGQVVEFDEIKESMMQNLLATGYEQKTADAYATVYAKTITNLAERAGIDPRELNRLSVTRQLPDVLTRDTRADVNVDPLIDAIREGKIPTDADVMGQSLFDFIREMGGMQDDGGELVSRDLNLLTPAGRRNLIQEGGLALDRAREMAAEAGFLPMDSDLNDFFELIDREASGELVYSDRNVNQQMQAMRENLRQLEEFIDTLGIDLSQITDNAEVRRLIRQATESPEMAEGFNELAQSLLESRGTPIFFSQLSKAIGDAKQASMPAKQWASWLNSNAAKLGIKKEEIQFTGITEWLELQEGKVSKEDIQEFLDNNGVQVEEVMLGDSSDVINMDSRFASIPEVMNVVRADQGTIDNALVFALENDYAVYQAIQAAYPEVLENENFGQIIVNDLFNKPIYADRPETIPDDLQALFDRVETNDIDLYALPREAMQIGYEVDMDLDGNINEINRVGSFFQPTKYKKFVVEGGENYKELLLKLPETEVQETNMLLLCLMAEYIDIGTKNAQKNLLQNKTALLMKKQ
jgi:hypothetical protein